MTSNCIFFISQHNLGMGHFRRIQAIVNCFSQSMDTKVVHISGGHPFEFESYSSNVEFVQLQYIQRKSINSSALIVEGSKSVEETNVQRANKIINTFNKYQPRIIVTEFYPFSSHRLDESIIPLLNHIKKNHLNVKVICSLRDIPVSDLGKKTKQIYTRVNQILREFYTCVLFHSDCKIVDYQITPHLDYALKGIEVIETGYVVQMSQKEMNYINTEYDFLIMAGGGIDGKDSILSAYKMIVGEDRRSKILIICGPFMRNDDFEFISKVAAHSEVIKQVTSTQEYILKSRNVISMSGYNSVAECICHHKKLTLMPRKNSFEQEQRAHCFHNVGLAYYNENSGDSFLNVSKPITPSLASQFNFNGALNSMKILSSM